MTRRSKNVRIKDFRQKKNEMAIKLILSKSNFNEINSFKIIPGEFNVPNSKYKISISKNRFVAHLSSLHEKG